MFNFYITSYVLILYIRFCTGFYKIFIVLPRSFINLNHRMMISNILNGRLTSSYQRKRLVSLENCYMQLKPYFKVKRSGQVKKNLIASVQEKSKNTTDQTSFNLIEQNQIMYAKLMTEKLLKG
ncbi:conserved hypothetical protein [Maribacter litoralis]|uniref:Uncharacterized protein n=1 Tax=Maribacter litoralis TaxID=2059726 RepID=A0A653SDF0_9FLAO|nr:conserved hypothetical protein [Maribacter litoralis]